MKKKIGSVKCLGKKDKEPEGGSDEKNSSNAEKKMSAEDIDGLRADHSNMKTDHARPKTDHPNARADHSDARLDHKRKSIVASESSCKRLRKEAPNEHKSKVIVSKDRKKEQEMDKIKSRRNSSDKEKV